MPLPRKEPARQHVFPLLQMFPRNCRSDPAQPVFRYPATDGVQRCAPENGDVCDRDRNFRTLRNEFSYEPADPTGLPDTKEDKDMSTKGNSAGGVLNVQLIE